VPLIDGEKGACMERSSRAKPLQARSVIAPRTSHLVRWFVLCNCALLRVHFIHSLVCGVCVCVTVNVSVVSRLTCRVCRVPVPL
jgi:hypothetical protein